MRFWRIIRGAAAAMAVIVFLSACATTKVINSWHEDRYQGPTLKRFLVIGMSSNPNRRRYFETAFSKELTAAGLAAEPSFRLIPEDDITEEKTVIEAAVAQSDADAILTTRLVDISREQSYVPPSFDYAPLGFYDYYYPTYRMMFRPGYVVTNTTVILETRVYAAHTKKLLWTGSTRSFNPTSADRVVEELSGIVVKELARYGFIAARE